MSTVAHPCFLQAVLPLLSGPGPHSLASAARRNAVPAPEDVEVHVVPAIDYDLPPALARLSGRRVGPLVIRVHEKSRRIAGMLPNVRTVVVAPIPTALSSSSLVTSSAPSPLRALEASQFQASMMDVLAAGVPVSPRCMRQFSHSLLAVEPGMLRGGKHLRASPHRAVFSDLCVRAYVWCVVLGSMAGSLWHRGAWWRPLPGKGSFRSRTT